jgi:hypothetical protein
MALPICRVLRCAPLPCAQGNRHRLLSRIWQLLSRFAGVISWLPWMKSLYPRCRKAGSNDFISVATHPLKRSSGSSANTSYRRTATDRRAPSLTGFFANTVGVSASTRRSFAFARKIRPNSRLYNLASATTDTDRDVPNYGIASRPQQAGYRKHQLRAIVRRDHRERRQRHKPPPVTMRVVHGHRDPANRGT